LSFVHTSTADHATLTVNGGTNGGGGGAIFFFDDSLGGRAKITLSGNGTLDLSSHKVSGITIGGLRGDGLVSLGASTLTVNNKPNSTFGGLISGSGALIQGTQGILDLTNPNTYGGGTSFATAHCGSVTPPARPLVAALFSLSRVHSAGTGASPAQ